jgi:hypothetical protein
MRNEANGVRRPRRRDETNPIEPIPGRTKTVALRWKRGFRPRERAAPVRNEPNAEACRDRATDRGHDAAWRGWDRRRLRL